MSIKIINGMVYQQVRQPNGIIRVEVLPYDEWELNLFMDTWWEIQKEKLGL